LPPCPGTAPAPGRPLCHRLDDGAVIATRGTSLRPPAFSGFAPGPPGGMGLRCSAVRDSRTSAVTSAPPSSGASCV
jgi:hypothetical protein